MDRLKKIFRNPVTDILFLVGLVISSIIILNIADLASRIVIETKSQNPYKYTKVVDFAGSTNEINTQEKQSKFKLEYFDNFTQGNVYFIDAININKIVDEYIAYILVEDNEEFLYEFREGGYDRKAEYTNAVVIGESLEQFATSGNGERYIYIDDYKYNVIGILKNNMSANIDTMLYVFWDTLDSGAKEKWLKSDFTAHLLHYESNINDFTFIEDLANEAMQYGIEVLANDDISKSTAEQNEKYQEISKVMFIIALIFSILTCLSVSYIWLHDRRKELSIRTAYGYTKSQIFILLYRDVLKLTACSTVLAIIIQCIYSIITGENLLFDRMILLRILVIFIGVLSIVTVITIYMARSLKAFSAVKLNEGT